MLNPLRRKLTLSILFLIITITTVFTACGDKKSEEKPETEKVAKKDSTASTDVVTLTSDQYKVAATELGKVEMRSLSSVLKGNETIDVTLKM